MNRTIIPAVLAGLLGAAAADAAVVTYTLVKDDFGTGAASPGSFAVYASVNGGDNKGLASFGFALQGGTFSTVQNRSPQLTFTNSDEGTTKTAGFTLLRSSGTSSNTLPVVSGSQNTTQPAEMVAAFGIGQTGGDLSTLTPPDHTNGSTTFATYGAPVLLARGTYSGAGPAFNQSSVDNVANVFTNASTSASFSTQAATLQFVTTVVPEPTTLGGLGAAAMLLVRRRRAV